VSQRYIPRGYSGSEQALVLIAKANHPERWRDGAMLDKEREIYDGLGRTLNAEILGDHLRVMIPEPIRSANTDVIERLCDFEDAAHRLRECLHAGDLVGKYLDEDGAWHTIPTQRWAANDGLEAILSGVVVFDEGPHLISRLILLSVDELKTALKASETHKSETDGCPPEHTAPSKPRSRRGAPKQYDWDEAKQFVFGELNMYGDFDLPENQDDGWRSQNDLIGRLQEYMASDRGGGRGPSDSSAKTYVANWVAEWRAANNSPG
jgi:hypothetical protein